MFRFIIVCTFVPSFVPFFCCFLHFTYFAIILGVFSFTVPSFVSLFLLCTQYHHDCFSLLVIMLTIVSLVSALLHCSFHFPSFSLLYRVCESVSFVCAFLLSFVVFSLSFSSHIILLSPSSSHILIYIDSFVVFSSLSHLFSSVALLFLNIVSLSFSHVFISLFRNNINVGLVSGFVSMSATCSFVLTHCILIILLLISSLTK